MNDLLATMNETLAKRSLAVALAFSLVFALSRTITVIYRMVSAPAHSTMHLSARSMSHPVRPVVHLYKSKASAIPAGMDPNQLNGLTLNSNFRNYYCSFSGHVSCNGQPCSATIQVALNSRNNPDLKRTFQSDSDGSFNINLMLSEIPQEQVDWKLSVARGAMTDAEAHGRQILMDNNGLDVDQSFNLQ